MNGEGLRAARGRGVVDGAPGGVTDVCADGIADGAGISVDKVSGAVSQWVDQVGRFLGVLQVALEQSRPSDDASAEVRALSAQLPALIRQCRAQVPTPEMVRTWVKSLNDDDDAPQRAGA
jgi:hypothetical protein